ncbi:MAG: hypothetical protein ACK5CA_14195 [Cyanobacteriota bacterium]
MTLDNSIDLCLWRNFTARDLARADSPTAVPVGCLALLLKVEVENISTLAIGIF